MHSELTQLGHGAPYVHRQPPTCTSHSRILRPHIRNFRPSTSDLRVCADRFDSRRKEGAHVVHGTSGRKGNTLRRGLSEEDSDDLQSTEVSWWQSGGHQSEEADSSQQQLRTFQQLQQHQPSPSALPRAPRLSPFPRSTTESSRQSSQIGSSIATAPFSNRTLATTATTAASAAGDDDASSATPSTSNIMIPTQAVSALPPAGSTSPQSRALGLVSTVVSVLAVGAYVYTLVKRRQAEPGNDFTRTGGATTGAGTPAPPALAPKRPTGAGSGLFRSVTAVTPPNPTKTTTDSTVTTTAPGFISRPVPATITGPEQPSASPAREHGWWRRLARVYYISFGAKYGLVPRIRLDGSAGRPISSWSGATAAAAAVLVAFEDPADAEYVANALWEDLVQSGTQPVGPRPSTMGVLSAAPIFLEDLAAMRGTSVEVVPLDGLRKDVELSTTQLEVVLAALVRGIPPEAAAAEAERILEEAAAAAVADAEAEAEAVEPDAAAGSPSGGVRGSRSSSSGPSTGAEGGRAPGSTAAAVRNPPSHIVEQRGMKIKLPSKFDFPGFDVDSSGATLKPKVNMPHPATTLATSDAGVAPVMESASPSPAAATTAASAPPTTATTDTQRARNVTLGPVKPPASQPSTTTLPQVEPSAVREPARGDTDTDIPPSDRWMSYGDVRIIDTEAVKVSSGSDTTMATVAASSRDSATTITGDVVAVATTATTQPSEVDEAIREYRELENLLIMATGSGGGSAATAAVQRRGGYPIQETSYVSMESTATTAATGTVEDDGFNPQQVPLQQQQLTKRKSGAEKAADILARQGPTDSALEAALAAIEEENYERTEEDLFNEYHSIFNNSDKGNARNQDDLQSSTSRNSSGSRNSAQSSGSGFAQLASDPSLTGRVRGGGGGGVSDLTVEVAEVQRQLAGVIQAVAAAHASGSPPPADATDVMQRWQQQLKALQARLAAPPQPPTPAAAAPYNSRQSGGLFSATPSPRPRPNNAASVANNANTPPSAAATTDPAALVTPLNPAGNAAANVGARDGARRAWGSWKTNRRIQEAEATLLKTATQGVTFPSSEPTPARMPPPTLPTPTPKTRANGVGSGETRASVAATDRGGTDADGVVVLSKRVGTNRPPKVVEAPEVRQDRVKEALRVFSEMGNDFGAEDDDEDGAGDKDDQLFGRSASLLAGGRKPWWQQRFQALFLPTIGYPDGSMGFLQVNVSLNGDRRDMRVLAFEDRTDCTACVTLMAQWPDYEGTEPRMSMMPTERLLQQLQDIYDYQPDVNSGVTRPRGLAVFRRGKLPMRPGMGPDDFIQAVVYQHAAQMALARTGYGFNA